MGTTRERERERERERDQILEPKKSTKQPSQKKCKHTRKQLQSSVKQGCRKN
jgi:hypothetical protein